MTDKLPYDYEVICKADDPQWLEHRKTGIGASEMAALLGESPYKSALEVYAEKVGDIDPPDLSDREWIYWGEKLESIIIEEYEKRTGRIVAGGGTLLRSTAYPWALATLDATVDIGTNCCPLEIKTASAYKLEEWSNGPPEPYRIQVHQQMLVTGKSKASIACLIGGQKFVWIDVDRDDILMNRIIKAGAEFWNRVENRDPPLPDGTDSAKKALARMYPIEDISTVELSGDYIELDNELTDLTKRAKADSKRIAEIEQQIKAAIGKAHIGTLPNGVVYTYTTTHKPEHRVQANSFRVLRRKAPK
jgi:putative phage-type endonuclease